MDLRLVLIGLVVGLLVGLSGVGGSSLMTPLLILVLRVNPLVAVGTDLMYSVPTKLLGAYVHWRQNTVDRRVVLYLCLGGVPGAILGLAALVALRSYIGLATLNGLIKHGIGVLLLLAALAILLTPLLSRLSRKNVRPPALPWTPPMKGRTLALGGVVGFFVSLTSIGSGAIAVPILYILMPRLGLRRVIGSDVVFAAVLVPVAAAGHLGLGSVNLGISATLLLGSLPGVFIGSKLCAGLPDVWLRPAIAGTLIWAGVSLV